MPPRTPDWKREITHLVESHRARRSETIDSVEGQRPARLGQTAAHNRAARIAASVAARYASAPTYSELLEQRKAAAAEEIAKATATAELAVEAAMIATSAQWLDTHPYVTEECQALPVESQMSYVSAVEHGSAVVTELCVDPHIPGLLEGVASLTFEPMAEPAIRGTILLPELPARSAEMSMHAPEAVQEPALEDLLASSVITPPVPLPANLIEFPRELIAAKRVRPQLAEGPLRASRATTATEDAAQAQLRIFEVESNQQADTGASAEKAVATATVEEPRVSAWSSICLDAHPAAEERMYAEDRGLMSVPLQAASIDRRLMAMAVDFCLVSGAFLAFLFVFALSTPHLPTGKTAIVLCGVVYVALWMLYQLLFFTFSDKTAGMYYARIALCTFDDENPTRRALRRRIAAWWISAFPLGLGFAWAMLDEDNLSWHDRMCRIYQRSY